MSCESAFNKRSAAVSLCSRDKLKSVREHGFDWLLCSVVRSMVFHMRFLQRQR